MTLKMLSKDNKRNPKMNHPVKVLGKLCMMNNLKSKNSLNKKVKMITLIMKKAIPLMTVMEKTRKSLMTMKAKNNNHANLQMNTMMNMMIMYRTFLRTMKNIKMRTAILQILACLMTMH